MSSQWHVAKLSDVCDFYNGLWKGEKGPFVNVGVIRNTNFTKEGSLDYSDISYLDVEAKKFEKRRLQFGDIILEKSGGGPKQAVGRVAFFDKAEGDFSFSNFTSAIRVCDQDLLSSAYLHRFLYWQYVSGVTETMQSHSTGIRNLDGDAYKAIEIRFPEVAEQHRIVALLDEAFADIAIAKANAEKNLRNAREAFDTYLQDIFNRKGPGWISKSIGEIADIKGGKRVPKGYKLESEPTGFPYLRVTDFLDTGTIDTTNLRYVSADVHLGIKNYIIRQRDLYISIAGTIGKTGIIPGELDGANLTENACRLVFKEDVCNRYVYYFTTTKDFIDQVSSKTRIAAQPKLALSRLATIRLSLPSLDKQILLADYFDQLHEDASRLQSLTTRKLAALDELKQSLLQRAFSGEL